MVLLNKKVCSFFQLYDPGMSFFFQGFRSFFLSKNVRTAVPVQMKGPNRRRHPFQAPPGKVDLHSELLASVCSSLL